MVLVHTFTAPVKRATKFGQGIVDALMIVLLPLPDSFNKLFTTQVMSCLLLASPQHILDHRLRRNTSMITSRNPKCRLATHAIPPDQQILKRVSQSVAHV